MPRGYVRYRFEAGNIVYGISSQTDLEKGGGQGSFTKVITKKSIDEADEINNFPLKGKLQILYDLEPTARGGYGYDDDQCGTKAPEEYANRNTLTHLTDIIQKDKYARIANEYLVKNRIPPTYIRGIVVQDDNDQIMLHFAGELKPLTGAEKKKALIEKLADAKMITNARGEILSQMLLPLYKSKDLYINGTSVDKFIHVDNSFKTEYWNSETSDGTNGNLG